LGNANTWDDRYPSDNSPSAGDAAVSNVGEYGHVMYVESVNGNGTINISDYNRAGTGKYNTSTISAAGLSFLTF
jgi:surface antigen